MNTLPLLNFFCRVMGLLRNAVRKAFYTRSSQRSSVHRTCVGWCVSMYGQRLSILSQFQRCQLCRKRSPPGRQTCTPLLSPLSAFFIFFQKRSRLHSSRQAQPRCAYSGPARTRVCALSGTKQQQRWHFSILCLHRRLSKHSRRL